MSTTPADAAGIASTATDGAGCELLLAENARVSKWKVAGSLKDTEWLFIVL
jgi:hypothetical protein